MIFSRKVKNREDIQGFEMERKTNVEIGEWEEVFVVDHV